MRWLIDTSAWARRETIAVSEQLAALLDEEEGSEFVLSPTVLLELLRGPQGDQVSERRQSLTEAMEVVAADKGTWSIAADAMIKLALHHPTAHRLPVADLLTAALAHQHGLGVVHVDGDFELLAHWSGLTFPERRLELGDEAPAPSSSALRQRQLRRELAQLLHLLPAETAEGFLADSVRALESMVDGRSSGPGAS